MPKSLSNLVLGVMVGGLLATASSVQAQAPALGGNGSAATGANPFTNPYMNPYINPYLNPAATGGAVSRNDALLYLWSAQQQPGGLLSSGYQGRVGTGRATGASAVSSPGASKAAEMPRSAMTPGGGAAKYFNRGALASQMPPAPASKYGRHGRFFNHNGH